jgi:hypothetical protein
MSAGTPLTGRGLQRFLSRSQRRFSPSELQFAIRLSISTILLPSFGRCAKAAELGGVQRAIIDYATLNCHAVDEDHLEPPEHHQAA